ncbi:MAG TPA: hypothetical protein VGR90_04550 [Acidimicrobiales bacterium]|nr:hypothetical protein [Acidimicrobiales bacterium]
MARAEHDHDHTVEVSSHGARVTCSCGWESHRTIEESYSSKRDVLARWYDHYTYRRRLEAQEDTV